MTRISLRSLGALLPLAALMLGCKGREQSPADAGAILTARTLGLAYLEENRLPEAEQEFAKLIRLAPDEPSGHANLGLVYLRLGRYPDADREVARAVKLAPDDPDIRLLQATVWRLSGRAADANPALEATLKANPKHLASLVELRGPAGAPPGYPVLTFSARLALTRQNPQAVVSTIRFTEIASRPGMLAAALGVPGFDETRLARATSVTVGDYDNDGHLDVFADGLFHNKGDDTFSPSSAIRDSSGGAALFADFDHDGDLDLFLGGRLYRNNGDGSFKEQRVAPEASRAVFGSFDGDPRIDLIVESKSTVTFYKGLEEGRFEAHTLPMHAAALAAGDYDNDGSLDLFAGGFYRNDGAGNFTLDRRADVGHADVIAAVFFDFDNDGWLGLILASRTAVTLLHNETQGRFTDRSALLPAALRGAGARQVASLDIDGDGDLDLLIVGVDGRLHLLRNDVGNANQFVDVGLIALRDGSGKNNHFGIGSRLEMRAGDLYQTRVVDQPGMHFGPRHRLKADVLRGVGA